MSIITTKSPIITELSQLDPTGHYTYGDYLTWRFSEWVELIRGRIVKRSSAPSRRHAEVSGNLFVAFKIKLKHTLCKAYHAPFDVRLPRQNEFGEKVTTVVQPDVCVICDPSILDDKGCTGPPNLMVEVISPGTGRHDRLIKLPLYEETGVLEYWLVHSFDQCVDQYVLEQGKYRLVNIIEADEAAEIISATIEGLTISLSEIFSQD